MLSFFRNGTLAPKITPPIYGLPGRWKRTKRNSDRISLLNALCVGRADRLRKVTDRFMSVVGG